MRLFFVLVAVIALLGYSLAHVTVPNLAICSYKDYECPTVSRVGMGALHLGDRISGLSNATKINSWIQHAVSHGITLFDLADVYPVKGGDAGDSATLFGEALALTPGLREKITIVAKMGIIMPNGIDTTSEHLTKTLDWFLSVLKTSYVDVLMIHFSNSLMDVDQVVNTFQTFKDAGKVKHFGVSNHYPSKFDLLQSRMIEKFNSKLITHEFEISAWNPSYLNYNSPLVDHAYQTGIHPLAWGAVGGDPLGGLNRLFVKEGERQTRIKHALRSVGRDLDIRDDSTVALLWLLSHPSGIIPLLGTTSSSRLDTQLEAFNYLGQMTNDQWWQIADAGGVCPLGDSQCNYDLYR